jgi:hypothetical protein
MMESVLKVQIFHTAAEMRLDRTWTTQHPVTPKFMEQQTAQALRGVYSPWEPATIAHYLEERWGARVIELVMPDLPDVEGLVMVPDGFVPAESLALKHLPGQHAQLSQGHRGGEAGSGEMHRGIGHGGALDKMLASGELDIPEGIRKRKYSTQEVHPGVEEYSNRVWEAMSAEMRAQGLDDEIIKKGVGGSLNRLLGSNDDASAKALTGAIASMGGASDAEVAELVKKELFARARPGMGEAMWRIKEKVEDGTLDVMNDDESTRLLIAMGRKRAGDVYENDIPNYRRDLAENIEQGNRYRKEHPDHVGIYEQQLKRRTNDALEYTARVEDAIGMALDPNYQKGVSVVVETSQRLWERNQEKPKLQRGIYDLERSPYKPVQKVDADIKESGRSIFHTDSLVAWTPDGRAARSFSAGGGMSKHGISGKAMMTKSNIQLEDVMFYWPALYSHLGWSIDTKEVWLWSGGEMELTEAEFKRLKAMNGLVNGDFVMFGDYCGGKLESYQSPVVRAFEYIDIDEEQDTEKHLAGQHNQKRHGWRYGSGGTSNFESPEERRTYLKRESRRLQSSAHWKNRNRRMNELRNAYVDADIEFANHKFNVVNPHHRKMEVVQKRLEKWRSAVYMKDDARVQSLTTQINNAEDRKREVENVLFGVLSGSPRTAANMTEEEVRAERSELNKKIERLTAERKKRMERVAANYEKAGAELASMQDEYLILQAENTLLLKKRTEQYNAYREWAKSDEGRALLEDGKRRGATARKKMMRSRLPEMSKAERTEMNDKHYNATRSAKVELRKLQSQYFSADKPYDKDGIAKIAYDERYLANKRNILLSDREYAVATSNTRSELQAVRREYRAKLEWQDATEDWAAKRRAGEMVGKTKTMLDAEQKVRKAENVSYEMRQKQRNAGKEMLFQEQPLGKGVFIQYDKEDERTTKNISAGIEAFSKLSGNNQSLSVGKTTVGTYLFSDETLGRPKRKLPDGRAFEWNGHVWVSQHGGPEDTVHELGHVLERKDPFINFHVIDYFKQRTAGYSEAQLGRLYRKDEVGVKDGFVIPYVGKFYGPRDSPIGTEILSVGMEMFFTNPIKLARLDPDMFDFVYAVLRAGNEV